ncbi:flagellar export protein FliJ [Gracilimonas mengyeensis]|uniref:Flagellar FliJ protein n=1 Tax=Gracilimonas mengyeensis TaxID=1302730 RepID=A0A521EDV8_9BACT|nr:flagellar export protein FliJ [Gracilimonas mengyeensis]SMO81641.1 flagellar export protein FliJ [Gracilimonas mengyeensis]
MKFKFSLDPVLKVRKHQKKIKKQKLAEEVAEKQKIAQLQQEIQHKLENYLENTESKEIQNVQMVRRHAAHMEEVHRKMKELSKELSKADKKVDAARQDLAEAHKSLHMIEKVKEFELDLHKDKVSKEENKFLDEIATQSFSR